MNNINIKTMNNLKNVKEWKTTILGVVTAVITILVATGVVDPIHEQEIRVSMDVIVSSLGTIVASIASLWLIFKSKDSDEPPKKD